jgi:large subunit ribosomal protein L32
MGLPGHRRTSSDKRRRAAHDFLERLQVGTCPNCHAAAKPHCVCKQCGMYKGRQVLNVERRTTRLVKKAEKKTRTTSSPAKTSKA